MHPEDPAFSKKRPAQKGIRIGVGMMEERPTKITYMGLRRICRDRKPNDREESLQCNKNSTFLGFVRQPSKTKGRDGLGHNCQHMDISATLNTHSRGVKGSSLTPNVNVSRNNRILVLRLTRRSDCAFFHPIP
jgi:hypothetical protein